MRSVLGLIEGSFGFDLEVIALLNDGKIQHFWRSNQWYAGPVFGTSPIPPLIISNLPKVNISDLKETLKV